MSHSLSGDISRGDGHASVHADEFKHSVGDHLRTHFQKLHALAGKFPIQNFVKYIEPSFKMLGQQRRFFIQLAVYLQRISTVPLVVASPEKHCLPKIADDRKMMIKIEVGYVGKDIADLAVTHRPAIKLAHQMVDIIPVLDVFLHIHTGDRFCLQKVIPRANNRTTLTASHAI